MYVKKDKMADGTRKMLFFYSIAPVMGLFLRGRDGLFQVVWQTDLEVDLERTQNYCVGLLALN